MIRHGLRELQNYFWKQKFRIVYNKKFWFSFKFQNTKFLFVVTFDLICWSRCGLVGKFQNVHNHPLTPSFPRWSTHPLHHKKTNKWWNFNPCCWLDFCLPFSSFNFTTISFVIVGWDGITGSKVDGTSTIVSLAQVECSYANWATSNYEKLL